MDKKKTEEVSNVPSQTLVTNFLKDTVPQGRLSWVMPKLKHKPIMLDTTTNARRQRKRKPQKLSNKQKKKLGMLDIPAESCRYEYFLPVHNLWKEYMSELLGTGPKMELKNIETKLLKADYHGAYFTVKRSKCPSYVGLQGIVAQERKNIFKLITEDNRLIVVPKYNSVFEFVLLGHAFTIFGNEFRYTSAARSGRKFKSKAIMEFT